MVKVKIDMTGWNMWEHGVPDSRITVLQQVEDRIEPSGNRVAQWLCECSCEENTKLIVNGYDLRSGHTKSCGCIQREWTIESNKINKWSKKYNDYKLNLEDEYGLYGIGYCTNTGREFYFDMDDYDKIMDICWYENVTETGAHRVVGMNSTTKKPVKMHTLLGYKAYDHIDRNEFNNRKNNLRIANSVEQARNRGLSVTNKSGITGVCWLKTISKWQAYVTVNHKRVNLGAFANKEEAIVARLKAEKQYYGEFAPQKHLYEQYGI